ncbi:MAG: ABC transporter permease [Clostridium sp.]|uniref:ABC transporter permease n=1 Tax=Clostridium sp. TaxID=1506 RepID=UPI003F33B52A
MLKYIAKRFSLMVLTLFIVVTATFFLIRLMPGSPFNDDQLGKDQIEMLQENYGLNDGIVTQYVRYMGNVIRGDFGESFQNKKEVKELIADRLPTTVRLGMQALLLGTVIGILIGVIAAIKRNTVWDYGSTVLAVLGISVPSFIFAILLQSSLGVDMKIFPVIYTRTQPFMSSILPTIALSVGVIATVARFMRTELIEVMGSDYILLAEAKGVKGKAVIVRHALRNALIPVITIMGPMTVGLLTGSTVIEQIFSVPGVGSLLVNGILTNDYFVIVGVAMFYSFLYLFALFIVDILYGIIDPRIRVAGGKS